MYQIYVGSMLRTALPLIVFGLWGMGALASDALAAPDNTPPPPYISVTDASNNQSLGGLLEEHLQAMIKQCIGTKLTAKKSGFRGKVVDISSVPTWLANGLGLHNNPYVFKQTGMNISREFGYIYNQKEMDLNEITRSADNDYLPLDYSKGDDQVVSVGTDMALYQTTCSNVINEKVGLSGGYSFPMATIKAALAAEYEGSNSYSINIVYGTFQSPIYQMYTNNDPGAKSGINKFTASMVFWKWYLDNPYAVTDVQYILKSFTGLSLYRLDGLKRKTSFTINASANLTSPVVSASTDSQLAFNQFTKGAVIGYISASNVKGGRVDRAYDRLPTPAEIQHVVTAVSQDVVSFDKEGSGDLTLVSNIASGGVLIASKTIKYLVLGLPSQMCNLSSWTTDQPDSVSLRGAIPSVGDKNLRCALTFEYQPTAADLASGKTLKFNLVSKSTLGTVPIALQIAMPSVGFGTTSNPKINFAEGDRTPRVQQIAGQRTSTLMWEFEFNLFTDSSRRITNIESIDVNNLDLSCPEGVPVYAPPIPGLSFPTVGSGSPRKLTMRLTAAYQGTPQDLSQTENFAKCSYGGSVVYTFPDGSQRTGLINPIPIFYPIDRPSTSSVPGQRGDAQQIPPASVSSPSDAGL